MNVNFIRCEAVTSIQIKIYLFVHASVYMFVFPKITAVGGKKAHGRYSYSLLSPYVPLYILKLQYIGCFDDGYNTMPQGAC